MILTAALTPNVRSTPLLSGQVSIDGIEIIGMTLNASELYWRQLRFEEFDLCEMSISSMIIATANGLSKLTALPVFNYRRFFHTSVVVREGSGITSPGDLKGKRIGVPEYQQTWAVWSRGILRDEFGVDPRECRWYMERPPETSHGGAVGFSPPPGVELHYVPSSSSIAEMLLASELDASLLNLAVPNLVDRGRIDLANKPGIRPLFPDAVAEIQRYYEKTGLFPINHVVAVRTSLLEGSPDIALKIYDGLVRAKQLVDDHRLSLLEPYVATGMVTPAALAGLQHDPLPYGMRGARREVETIARYDFEQGLAKRHVGVEELFAASTLDT